ncbi:hypothetical protein [Nonomuraea insulae]|uniref:HK97 gp10 family phage protein n=1 Tax=Nonomuraea insulae TaxID=1616787 RepID=A0ABW1DAQ2_9ACTN
MDIDIDTSTSGPVFNGQARAAVTAFIDEAEEEIARRGVNIVHSELDRVLRNPTGYYEGHIQTDRTTGDSVVTDGGVIYGPWLAGVGSRNAPETRFAGYAHWRLATQRLQAEAADIAEKVLPQFIRRME